MQKLSHVKVFHLTTSTVLDDIWLGWVNDYQVLKPDLTSTVLDISEIWCELDKRFSKKPVSLPTTHSLLWIWYVWTTGWLFLFHLITHPLSRMWMRTVLKFSWSLELAVNLWTQILRWACGHWVCVITSHFVIM